jgi:aspartyl-tRNA synthetase
LEFVDVSQAVAGCSFRVFAGALADGGCVKAIRLPQGSRVSNSRLKPPKGDVVNEAIAAGEGTGCVLQLSGSTAKVAAGCVGSV